MRLEMEKWECSEIVTKKCQQPYIWYNEEAEKGVFIRTSTVFTESDSNNTIKKKIIASRKDSIKIIKNKWTLLKKGKISIE